MIPILIEGIGWTDTAFLLNRVTVGAFFLFSGYHKLFNAQRHRLFVDELQALRIPALRINSWWVPLVECLAGAAVLIGFLAPLAALGLLVIVAIAMSTSGRQRIRSYKPIDEADRIDDWLYLPETLYAVMLLMVISAGAGAYSVDHGIAIAGSKLPDPVNAGVADKLYRLDCGHSLANDESVWTPGENVGRSIEFSSTCWLIKHRSEWLLWDTGVPQSALNNPQGWSTLPKLIVYHLDHSITDQLAEIGLKPADIGRVAISHTHGDHIGNMGLFENSTVLMQRAEFNWIHSPDGQNDNVNQLMALARKLLGTPKKLQLLDGDTDVFADGSVTLVSTPGHTPGHQSLLVHLKESGFIVLSGDVAHSEENFRRDIVPALNTNREQSIASMEKIKQVLAAYHARLFINHDKSQTDGLKRLPELYQ